MTKQNPIAFIDRPDDVDRFIVVLTRSGNVSAACREVEISRDTAYRNRRENEVFASRWDEAEQTAADALEAEAWRRGMSGVKKPALYQGDRVWMRDEKGEIITNDNGEAIPIELTEYSDTLLITLLKGHRPEKYNEKLQVTGPGGGAMIVETVVKLSRRNQDVGATEPGSGGPIIDGDFAEADDPRIEEIGGPGTRDAEGRLSEMGPGGEDEPSGGGLGDPVYGEPLRYSDADR